MIEATKHYLKDLNDNNLANLSANSGKSKKYFHFSERPTDISNPKLLYPKQSEGLQSVLLGSPREETIVNYPIGNGIDQQFDKTTIKTMVLGDGYEQPLRLTDTAINPTQLAAQVTDEVKSGKTISVSTCQCCGNETKPVVGGQNKYTWKYLTDIKTLRGRKYQHVDSFSRESTPVEGYKSTNNAGKYERCNSSTSQSRKVSPISWKSTSTSSSNIKGLQFKGCHACNRSRPYSFSSSRANSSSTKNEDCPYSIVLGSLHPILHPCKPNYRSTRNAVNRSTRKDETRRSLIMIFTITSILLFLMVSYYGTIIYLRMKNSKSQ